MSVTIAEYGGGHFACLLVGHESATHLKRLRRFESRPASSQKLLRGRKRRGWGRSTAVNKGDTRHRRSRQRDACRPLHTPRRVGYVTNITPLMAEAVSMVSESSRGEPSNARTLAHARWWVNFQRNTATPIPLKPPRIMRFVAAREEQEPSPTAPLPTPMPRNDWELEPPANLGAPFGSRTRYRTSTQTTIRGTRSASGRRGCGARRSRQQRESNGYRTWIIAAARGTRRDGANDSQSRSSRDADRAARNSRATATASNRGSPTLTTSESAAPDWEPVGLLAPPWAMM